MAQVAAQPRVTMRGSPWCLVVGGRRVWGERRDEVDEKERKVSEKAPKRSGEAKRKKLGGKLTGDDRQALLSQLLFCAVREHYQTVL